MKGLVSQYSDARMSTADYYNGLASRIKDRLVGYDIEDLRSLIRYCTKIEGDLDALSRRHKKGPKASHQNKRSNQGSQDKALALKDSKAQSDPPKEKDKSNGNRNRSGYKQRSNKYCTFCKRTGHTFDEC